MPGKLSTRRHRLDVHRPARAGRRLQGPPTGRGRATARRSPTTSRFHTEDLTLDEQTYPSVAPLQGETVGVGMPVIVTFDVPVTDKASFEKHMSVNSTPQQPGAWHWISDNEAHWRPKNVLAAGTKVERRRRHQQRPRGRRRLRPGEPQGRVHGRRRQHLQGQHGHPPDAGVLQRQAAAHHPDHDRQSPKFTTRSGVKVIIEKFREKRMNSETVGIDRNSPDGLRHRRRRVRHAGHLLRRVRPRRPWSVGSQGYANVSHGCTGMSTDNAGGSTTCPSAATSSSTPAPTADDPHQRVRRLEPHFADWSAGSALS